MVDTGCKAWNFPWWDSQARVSTHSSPVPVKKPQPEKRFILVNENY
jgi:hypothetical protein